MKKNSISDVKINKGKITMITRHDIVDDPKRENVRSSAYQKMYTDDKMSDPDPVEKNERKISRSPRVYRKRPLVRKNLRLGLLLCVLFGLAFFALNILENAHVVITPKHQVFPLTNEPFVASKDDGGLLHFEIMILSDRQVKDMTLTQSQQVSNKAKALVTLYNEFSTKPQTVTAGTFVADKSGKTYKLDTTVKIPGYTLDPKDKTKIIPGTTGGSITAFLPGDSYNSTQTDFSITSYKGTTKATKIYIKTKTPLTGGAEGLVFTPTASEQGALEAQAQTVFKTSIYKKLNAQVPEGYVLYPNASTFTYLIDSQVQSPQAQAKIGIEGTVSAIILKKQDLIHATISHMLPNTTATEEKEITIPDITLATFAFTNPGQVITKDMQTVSFNLTGNATFNWNPDVPMITSLLLGTPYANVAQVLSNDPGISHASVKIFPPWKKNLPYDTSKIHVSVVQ